MLLIYYVLKSIQIFNIYNLRSSLYCGMTKKEILEAKPISSFYSKENKTE